MYIEKYEKVIKINKFKTSALTWNEELELPDRYFSVSNIQDHFENIFNKTWRKD